MAERKKSDHWNPTSDSGTAVRPERQTGWLIQTLASILILGAGLAVGFGVMTMAATGPEKESKAADQNGAPVEGSEKTSPKNDAEQSKPKEPEVASPDSHTQTTRDDFLGKFYTKFLSADCAANPNSENGTQFGGNYYTEFKDSRRVRYVEGLYRFEKTTVVFVIDDENSLTFIINGDKITFTSVTISNMSIPVSPEVNLSICSSDPHLRPDFALKIVGYTINDGFRYALLARDREATNQFLSQGAFLPAPELTTLLKSLDTPDQTITALLNTSRQNEKATAGRLETTPAPPPAPAPKP